MDLLLEKSGESSDIAFVTAHISRVSRYILAMCKQHESKRNCPTSAVGLSSRVAVKKMFTFLWVDFHFSFSENARLAFGGGICVQLNSYHFDDQDKLMIVSVPDTNGEISRGPDWD